jgi:Tol biopolymer transport system component
MPIHLRLTPYCLITLLMLLLFGCGGTQIRSTQVTAKLQSTTTIFSDRPSDAAPNAERNIILNYTRGTAEETKLLLVDANNGEVTEWQLKGHRLNDPKAPCGSSTVFQGLSWSPQRQQLLFAAYLNCQYGDYLIDKNGTVSNLKIPTLRYPQRPLIVESPRLSPDGTTVAYLDTNFKTGKGTHNVYLFDIRSQKSRQLTTFIDRDVYSLQTVVWSPDGEFLVVAGLDAQRIPTVWQVKRDDAERSTNRSNLTMLLRDSAAQAYKLPVEAMENYKVSPDGRYLAFLASANGKIEKAAPTIWLLDLQTKAVQQLLEPAKEQHRAVRAFDWSPDGKRLVLSAGFDAAASCDLGLFAMQSAQNCRSNTALYLINRDGSNLTRLTKIETTPDSKDTLKWFSYR